MACSRLQRVTGINVTKCTLWGEGGGGGEGGYDYSREMNNFSCVALTFLQSARADGFPAVERRVRKPDAFAGSEIF